MAQFGHVNIVKTDTKDNIEQITNNYTRGLHRTRGLYSPESVRRVLALQIRYNWTNRNTRMGNAWSVSGVSGKTHGPSNKSSFGTMSTWIFVAI